ncbi:MAG: hemolysin family protein [Lentisphaeria bacterium]|nr:hemolysin family protein [Lentisphaeria bacterium]
MSTSLPLTAALISSIGFAFLALAAVKLETFNKAKLRKLRENSKRLAEELEEAFPIISRLRLAAHLLVLLMLLGSTLCYLGWAADKSRLLTAGTGVLLTLLILLFLEITIEKLSLPATARLLVFFLPLFKLATWLFSPLVFPLDIWIQRIREQDDDPLNLGKVTAEDEILSLVEDDEEEEPGAASSSGLELDEKRMLNGVINLDKTFVHEIMTPRVDMDVLPETASIEEMKKTIAETGHSRIPIYHQSIDSISGIVYAKDLLDDARVEKAANVRAIAHSPVFIPESKNVSDLLDEFRQTRNHLAIVLDEYGGTAGVVTIEDILEEIVGEIRDEYDHDEPSTPEVPHLEEDGSLINDGRMTIWEVNQLLDVEISEEQGFDTLGGYIMASQGKIPKKGEHLITEHLEIDIIDADRRKLILVKVRKRENTGKDSRTED